MRTTGIGDELPAAIAKRWSLPRATARGVVLEVLAAVRVDLQRGADAVAVPCPELGTAARLLATRLEYAADRIPKGRGR